MGCVMPSFGFGAECKPGKVDVHHLRHGQGMTDRASDWLTVPLCEAHHDEQPFGIHYPKSFYGRTKLSELDLLARTIELLASRR